MRKLPKKVLKELSVNESFNRWVRQQIRDLSKRTDIKLIVQRRKNGNLYRLPINNIDVFYDGTTIEVGE